MLADSEICAHAMWSHAVYACCCISPVCLALTTPHSLAPMSISIYLASKLHIFCVMESFCNEFISFTSECISLLSSIRCPVVVHALPYTLSLSRPASTTTTKLLVYMIFPIFKSYSLCCSPSLMNIDGKSFHSLLDSFLPPFSFFLLFLSVFVDNFSSLWIVFTERSVSNE